MIPGALFGRRQGARNPRIHNLSRREFLVRSGLGGSGLVLGLSACGDDENGSPAADAGVDAGGLPEPIPVDYTSLDTFVSVGDDGSVRVTVPRSEMGQGVRTSLAMLVAEEIGARWEDVRVTQAPGDAIYGDQNTDSSSSVRVFWQPLRKAGAAAREMLIAAAAAQLGVDPSELRVEDSAVVHDASGDRLGFAELASAAAMQPVPANPPLKSDAGVRTIIGQKAPGVDVSDIVTGRAIYGIDVEVPGMLHASLERSPTLNGSIVTYDADAAKAVPGVRDVIELEGNRLLTNNAVAVVAEHTWAAMAGRLALGVQWDPGSSSLEQTDEHRALIADTAKMDGKPSRDDGDFDAALAAAARTIEAEYSSPYLAHSPMEPLVAVADVRADAVEIWAPTQDPVRAAKAVADLLGVPEASVKVNVTLLGGGFGRKSQPDFILEAAAVSKAVGSPVKVTWTREDEVRHGFYRPENRQRLVATLDDQGAVTGLSGHSVFSTFMKLFIPGSTTPSPTELGMGWTNAPFDVPSMRMSATCVPSALRIGWWRAVCNTFHGFALSSFVDELAADAGEDSIEYYLQLLGAPRTVAGYDTGRLSGVVERVKTMGLWGKSVPAGEGIGFAAHMSFSSYVAMVVHVAVDPDKKLTIKEVDYAVDCGTAVNPDGIAAQCEGGLVFGLSAALYGEITVKDSAVVQGNFDDYRMLRIDRMPKVNVTVVESSEAPTGIGEPPTPVVAPALVNAIFAATGERVRDLPLSAQGYT